MRLALGDLGDGAARVGGGGWTAIHDTDVGRLALLAGLTWLVLFPLSLAGLGEMDVVSIFGAVMVVILSGYTVYVAAASGHGISPSEIELKWSTLPESLSELGFAFWLQARSEFGAIRRNYSAQFCAILRRPPPSPPQPCVLPLLRELPEGEVGERVMTKALHLTFSLTTLVYATIGLAGYIAFGDATPPNILGGFKGAVGGVLAFVFCAYICLCFAPTVPPLRETLLRLLCATARRRRPPPTPPPPRPCRRARRRMAPCSRRRRARRRSPARASVGRRGFSTWY